MGLRLIRLGQDSSQVGADIRVALTALGRHESLSSGVVLTGVSLPECAHPIDALALFPRGIVILIGVELPDPALRLEAPLSGVWSTDGWPLTREDGAINPSTEALRLADAVLARLRAAGLDTVPISAVIGVGPYVETVSQPEQDLARGVRVLYPSAASLLGAFEELVTGSTPCTAEQVQRLLHELAPQHAPGTATLIDSGFPDAVPPEVAEAPTRVLPTFTAGAQQPTGEISAGGPAAPNTHRRGPSRLALGAAAVLVMLLATGTLAIIAVTGSGDMSGAAPPSPESSPPLATVTVDGITFGRTAAERDNSCASHAFGDVAAALHEQDCTRLSRAEFEASIDDRVAVISIAVAEFEDERAAKTFQQTAQVPGSGGLKALRARGSDEEYVPRGAAFGTAQRANRVRLIQTAWRAQPSSPTDRTLIRLVESARKLPVSG